jgi:nicotinate-nucleotide pyrophosphorylase (carboxylating)
MQLDEMIMVKDNHLKVMGSCLKLPKLKNGYSIEIEVKTLKEFKEILKLRPQIIMLDNMKFKDMKKAVLLKKQLSAIGQPLSTKLEASGGITLKNIRKIASCGVGRISVGSLTHSFKSPDISLEVV